MKDILEHFSVEVFGTALLIVLGNGVVGNVLMKKTKGQNGGWLLITVGWGLAVTCSAILCIAIFSKASASFNPALTVALGISNIIDGKYIAIYIVAEFIGAFLGQMIVDLIFIDHIKEHINSASNNKERKIFYSQVLGMHSTGPGIRNYKINVLVEFIATAVLLIGLLAVSKANTFSTAPFMSPIFAGMLITTIGICLGGLTGFSLNPARDLSPRIVYQIIFGRKSSADWKYSWVPIVGPMLAGIVVGGLALLY